MTVKLPPNAWVAGEKLLAADLNDTIQAASSAIVAVAGENISASKPVYLNKPDGKLYTAHGFKELDSTVLNLAAAPMTSHKTAKLSDTQMMYLTDNGTTTLTISVIDINSASIVASQTVTTTFDQTTDSTPTLPSATMCRLSDTTFIVFYAKTGTNNLYFRTGSISGGTITMDTETAYSGSPDYCFGMDAAPGASDGKVVFTYFDLTTEIGGGGTATCTLSYLTCSTNTATVTYTTSYSQASGTYFSDPVWSRAVFTKGIAYGLMCCKDSTNQRVIKYNYINTFSGDVSNSNYVPSLESQTGTGVPTTYSQYIPHVAGHNGKIYFGWATYDGGTSIDINVKTVLEASSVGCKIIYQSSVILLSGSTQIFALPVLGNECGVIVSGFDDNVSGGYLNGSIYIQKGKIYGFYPGQTLGIRSSMPQAEASYSNSKDEIVVCYLDNSASGYIKQWKIPTPSDGIVPVAITSGNTGVAVTKQITLSGLTTGAEYFLKDTYTTVGDMDFKGTIPVGEALTSTNLLQGNG